MPSSDLLEQCQAILTENGFSHPHKKERLVDKLKREDVWTPNPQRLADGVFFEKLGGGDTTGILLHVAEFEPPDRGVPEGYWRATRHNIFITDAANLMLEVNKLLKRA